MPNNFQDLVNIFLDLIRTAVPVIYALALFVFFLGLVKFIVKAGDEKAIAEGKNLMKWGIIALFIMTSIWGILRFAHQDIGFSGSFGFPFLPTGP